MQISVKVPLEVSQYTEISRQSEEKSACEILADKLQIAYEEEQQAIKELDDLLEPTITALDNGEVVDQTAEEIVKEAIEELTKRQ